MLKRKFYNQLVQWKSSHSQECLFVKGARQIGKTFIIDYFGKQNYTSYLYINFILNNEATRIFEGSLEADTIFKTISAYYPNFRLTPGETLIFLDEIQACPRARTALKSFAIDGKADVVASGSLLGINFLDDGLEKERSQESIPVGYEKHMTMLPMDFEEFLWALGYTENSIGILRESFENLTQVPISINDKFLQIFREYITIGGMPEVVNAFVQGNSFSLAFEVQEQIIAKKLKFYTINAIEVARATGMGARINTIMQACFFAISNILPKDEAIAQIKAAIKKTYSKKGEAIVQKNYEAVDTS